MYSGERPIGAAKGRQSDTEALCQPPPPSRVVSTPVYYPHTLLSSYCMFLPALFETKQQLKGTGRMSAMLCSPVSLQVVQ